MVQVTKVWYREAIRSYVWGVVKRAYYWVSRIRKTGMPHPTQSSHRPAPLTHHVFFCVGGWQIFVAEAREELAGQQYFLFSWRLLLCDTLLTVYLLFVSLMAFLLALDVTPNIVANAILK